MNFISKNSQRGRVALILVPFLFPLRSNAQPEVNAPRVIRAVSISDAPRIDGVLDEEIWQRPGDSGFIQRIPDDGQPSSAKTEVWVAFDKHALYVAAQMYDSAPDSIISRLVRRDDEFASDWLQVGIDPNGDRQTGYYFATNPSGSIGDGLIYGDTKIDETWDAIWDVGVTVNENGWTAEFRIPFSQIRFEQSKEGIWGIDFSRHIQRRNEDSYFTYQPRNDAVRVSRWSSLLGLGEVEPPARIEVSPYVVGTAKFVEQPPVQSFNAGFSDPFVAGRDYFGNVGVDFKLGLSGNLTLDGTLNPDFAQVEVDPAVVNLTAFETFYAEKRPFFIEGSQILRFGLSGSATPVDIRWSNPSFFYSRRIGRTPQLAEYLRNNGEVTHEGYQNIPDRTTILGAAKISGKTTDGWSVAALTAVTDREYAEVDSAGVRFRDEVEPLTFYGVGRVLKEFNNARQGLGIISTVVERDLRDPRLEAILNKGAYSAAVDAWTALDEENDWSVSGWAGVTHVRGTSDRMVSLQQAPQHYFQRPDADYVNVDTSATSLTGWSSRLWLNKDKGALRFGTSLGVIDPSFESNDIGFHGRTDLLNAEVWGQYYWFEPDEVFRVKMIGGDVYHNYNFGGILLESSYTVSTHGQFLNYWDLYIQGGYYGKGLSDIATRGGPLMESPAAWFAQVYVSSDPRRDLIGSAWISGLETVAGAWQVSTGIDLTWKATTTLSLSLAPYYYRTHSLAQYVSTFADPTAAATYGHRYLFGILDQHQLAADIRMNWTFTPSLSLQMYMQPLLATGEYVSFRELAMPRTYDFREYRQQDSSLVYDPSTSWYTIYPTGPSGQSFSFYDPNFNFKSLRLNLVLRWEYLPGSTIYFVWTHEKIDYAVRGDFVFGRDFRALLRDNPDNIFSLKLTYWWSP